MAGTCFNKRRILDKDLSSSDVISLFTTKRFIRFTMRRFANSWKDYFD